MTYDEWLQDFKLEAQNRGIQPGILDAAFKDAVINEKVLELDRKQPEKTETFKEYIEKRLTPKLPLAKGKLRTHSQDLRRVQKKYGVPANLIVALWGMETHFGKITGNFFIINALATLAFDSRRSDFFRNELLEALKIVQNDKIPLDKLQGSWAGALGQTQFMPSTYNNHAVDENEDGIKDIWDHHLDIFASMANYLSNSGWKKDEPWGYEVELPAAFDESLISPVPHPVPDQRFIKRTTQNWAEMGVHLKDGEVLPSNKLRGAIIRPDKGGAAFLVYDNFFVIFKWNRSFNFALTVLLFSNKIGNLNA
ncbi:MAG: lytic murein transglycosylase [Alphaproteobacteria bacterium]